MKNALLAGIAVVFASTASAQHAAHEHGVADLRVALDGQTLLIEFESPLDNLVGFEHAPGNDAQHAALASAVAKLEDFASLFGTSAEAACVPSDVQVESPYRVEGHDDHEHHHDHKHDDHKHAHGHDDHKSAPAHADMYAVYELACERPDALSSIEVRVFEAFPRIRSIRAETATAKGQGAARLDKSSSRLAL